MSVLSGGQTMSWHYFFYDVIILAQPFYNFWLVCIPLYPVSEKLV